MYGDFLILGGAGLVGLQVCRHIVMRLHPNRIVVASLQQQEAEAACAQLKAEFGDDVEFIPVSGNLFVPTDLSHTPRKTLMQDDTLRRRLLGALFEDFEQAFQENHLVAIIQEYKPDVIVDCVNTATGLSYQDVFDGSAKVRSWIGEDSYDSKGIIDLEALLLSQSTPQIIRHVRILHRATTECNTKVYLKVGTTGTGGMGLNIPYTHSEDKPSKVLLAKNETAFGHTGLLFLLARTPNAPIVKEVKPAAMIGYRAVEVRTARDRHGNDDLVEAQPFDLDGDWLPLVDKSAHYERVGKLEMPIVDTGENGVFTRGEFAAITALGQMEYITPEEIARVVVLEIRGANTGRDVLSSMDASVLDPSYKAGLLRATALSDLEHAEESSGIPSVALGRLGPPELSKLLFEAHLFKHAYGSMNAILHEAETPERLSSNLQGVLKSSGVLPYAPSIGIPVLLPDGNRILRGPRINVPEVKGHRKRVSLKDGAHIERWAKKGWIDLHPKNMARWKARFLKMAEARSVLRHAGSAASSIHTYMGDSLEIGEVVAWIFNNELGGHRVK